MPFMVTSLVQMCRRRTLLTLLGSAGAALSAGLGIRGRGDDPAPRLEATFHFANRAGLAPSMMSQNNQFLGAVATILLSRYRRWLSIGILPSSA